MRGVERAIEARQQGVERLLKEGTNCYRLMTPGEGNGTSIDVYRDVAIVQMRDEVNREEIRQVLKQWKVYFKNFPKDRSHAEVPQTGEADSVVASENGKKFLIHPQEPYSVGLFLDQRENRKFLSEQIKPGSKVFNGFAYTCGFSVYAAASGAQVTSVDVSKRYLEWGKKNFELNGISLEGHRFIAEDCIDFMEREIRRGQKYDWIILDPPTFGRDKKGKVFSLQKEMEKLFQLSERLLVPGGKFFFSTNNHQIEFNLTGNWKKLELPKLGFDFQDQKELKAVLLESHNSLFQ